MSIPLITQHLINDAFDTATLQRAKSYVGKMQDIEFFPEENRFSAQVKGTARTPYEVDLYVVDYSDNGRLSLDGVCSCPVGLGCKHAAALALTILQQQSSTESTLKSMLPPNLMPLANKLASLIDGNPMPKGDEELLAMLKNLGVKLENPRDWTSDWIEQLEGLQQKPSELVAQGKAKKKASPSTMLYYVLYAEHGTGFPEILIYKGLIKPNTTTGEVHCNLTPWDNIDRALSSPPSFVNGDDLYILALLSKINKSLDYADNELQFWQHADMPRLFDALIATGRCYFSHTANDLSHPWQALHRGTPRQCQLAWEIQTDGSLLSCLVTEPEASVVIPMNPLHYIDSNTYQIGLVEHSSLTGKVLQHLAQLPPLTTKEQPKIAAAIQRLLPQVPLPTMDYLNKVREIKTSPVPVLRFSTVTVGRIIPHRLYGFAETTLRGERPLYDLASLSFLYGDIEVSPFTEPGFIRCADGSFVKLLPKRNAEEKWLSRLKAWGFLPFNLRELVDLNPQELQGTHFLNLESIQKWVELCSDGTLETMRQQGWVLHIPKDFRHLVLTVDAWELELNETEAGWLGVDMGILVDGERLPLAPLLYALFRRDPRWLDKTSLQQIKAEEEIILFSESGRKIGVTANRLKPLAETLVDLFNANVPRLSVPLQDAPRLLDVVDKERWQFHGNQSIVELAHTLRQAGDVQAIAPPQGLQIQLRTYQQEGLAWLQYLRQHNLAGILADDMGLGKTAQTLAHILLEKEAGRLDRPCLVILPTSLVFNWKREAARFAPALRILSLHGKDRAERFAQIPEHDVCLSTYPLLWRDREALKAQAYHLLILDEAQAVKNATSQAAQVVRELSARHRLCLTGTPLENHLGELWAQFDFLLPGFLGDSRTFSTTWRTPIEKQGNQVRREILANRLRPFILRRHKEEVASELPEKTVIVRSVELAAGQRDLYETVRSAMDARVREEIAAKGLARSQIVILDALLKLRQVCCDPRLLKSTAAAKVKERAKLDLLMEMLPEMVAEGRKILVFSQFTSMLDLIAEALQKHKLAFALLTGDTKDREAEVQSFQDGDKPIFLISLKAGGVGLNLTAADTVIHYDPWWNPAVENQATDRAHRLGQTKKVFVYKLVIAGSIEEKILSLQEKKADLAASILSEDHEGGSKFSDADLAALFAPLSD